MWLLDTATLELREFVGVNIPPYAILSHTWGADEITFRDMRKDRDAAKGKAGYSKVQKCCEKARQNGHQYVWIDTCCIDKRSSAELSEAINSMYRWYEDSTVCFVYLADVPSKEFLSGLGSYDALAKSRWFTRGWTLQELIAPRYIQFLGKDWKVIGVKASVGVDEFRGESMVIKLQNHRFMKNVANITGIKKAILEEPSSIRQTAAAQRMAWAARRYTTREEDLAYALMGLFGVSMPILYGEGLKKAFRRLQLEIIQMTTDQSIFVWRANRETSGLLADSPRDFVDSELPFVRIWPTLQSYSMTNMGLLVKTTLIARKDGSFIFPLRCWIGDESALKRICLILQRPFSSTQRLSAGNRVYRRKRCQDFEEISLPVEDEAEHSTVYILEDEQHELLSASWAGELLHWAINRDER